MMAGPGRDLSAELFGNAAPAGGRDLSADLFSAPAAPLARTDKIGRGMMDPIDGGAQLITHLLPNGLVQVGNQLNNWLADKTGLVPRLPEGGVDQQVRQDESAYQARRKAAGESGIDGYRTLGNVLSPANLALPTGSGIASAGLGMRAGMGALSGTLSGALTPVGGEGDFQREKLKQIAAGGAVGGSIPMLAAGLGRVISPKASTNANLQLLKDEGVQPTIGQALGGWAGKVEEKMQSAPIVGDMISHARGNANTQFQAAAFNRALQPVGESLPAGVTGRDAVTYTENVLKQRYDDVLGKIGAIPADQTFSAQVANLQQMVNRDVLSAAAKRKFQMVMNDVNNAIDQNGVLTSDAFKRVESSLGSDARKLAGSQDIYDGRLAPAVKQLQSELRDLLQRQAGSGADDLAAVNAGWANFKRVQAAAGRVGAEDGMFTPAQFQGAVRALDKSKDKAAFARGGALGQDLGDAGKSVLGGKVANSGTADRLLMNGGVLGSYLVNPMIPATALGGAAMYLSPVQRAMVAAASARPAFAQPVAQAFQKAAPLMVPAGAQFGLDMLGYQ